MLQGLRLKKKQQQQLTEKDKLAMTKFKMPEGIRVIKAGKQPQNFPITLSARQSKYAQCTNKTVRKQIKLPKSMPAVML